MTLQLSNNTSTSDCSPHNPTSQESLRISISRNNTMHPQTSSPLFDLLSELRAAIFGFIFQGTIVNKQDRLFVEPTVPECILLICKQAYSEAIVTYWTETTFEFAGLDWAACWVGSLANEAHAALIKEFKIWIMGNKVPGEVGMSCNREEINQHHEAELVEELTMFGFESGDLEVDVRALEMYDEFYSLIEHLTEDELMSI